MWGKVPRLQGFLASSFGMASNMLEAFEREFIHVREMPWPRGIQEDPLGMVGNIFELSHEESLIHMGEVPWPRDILESPLRKVSNVFKAFHEEKDPA